MAVYVLDQKDLSEMVADTGVIGNPYLPGALGRQMVLIEPPQLGALAAYETPIREGVSLRVLYQRQTRPFCILSAFENSFLSLNYGLRGSMDTELLNTSFRNYERVLKDKTSIGALAVAGMKIATRFELPPNEEFLVVSINVYEPVLRQFLADYRSATSGELEAALDRPNEKLFLHRRSLPPVLEGHLWDLINCQYEGFTRQLYFESKVLEILAGHFAHFFAPAQQTPRQQLSETDLEKIEAASQILQSRLQNPPTLAELARLTGLNEFKLKLGFRQRYGVSAFKQLQLFRLAAARRWLLETNLPIIEIAEMAGYQSLGAFSNLFKERYGVRPSDIRRG